SRNSDDLLQSLISTIDLLTKSDGIDSAYWGVNPSAPQNLR
ncbi:MAG: hypothetical protein ACI875_001040, partial [Planctomycetota bacterium]